MTIEMWFPTPIGVFDIVPPPVTDAVRRLATSPSPNPPAPGQRVSIWERDGEPLRALGAMMLECAREVMAHYPGRYKDIALDRGWIQTTGINGYSRAHTHPGSIVVGVCYLQAIGPGCGALVLHDPAAGARWVTFTDGNEDGFTWRKVEAKTGRIVIFPGHIVHSTEPNRNDALRIALSTNFRQAGGP